MKIAEIIEAIYENRINITSHARKEAREDALILNDITYSTCHGEIIEDYSTDYPYPSCLIYGNTVSGDPIHSVWAYDATSRIAVLVTVYRPDPARWINLKERRTP